MKLSADMIEKLLVSACGGAAEPSEPCVMAIRAHLAAGGGRVRAHICHDAGIALGLSEAESAHAAVVCELLHNASLVQDDLLDRSTTRRGAPSVWVTYGDAIAICAGDLMLSAAHGLLAEFADVQALPSALRLVHRRTREVILGQALEGVPRPEHESTEAYYDRLAQGKSASLLSLSLELPLLLSESRSHLTTAHAVACDFAVAYQIVDDLTDLAQDLQEGTLNLALLLIQHDGMSRADAIYKAAQIAHAKLAIAEAQAALLPRACAATLLHYASALQQSLNGLMLSVVSTTTSQV